MSDDVDWHKVGSRQELADNEVLTLEVSPRIAVFDVEGEIFAVADTCTHDDFPLSDGFVEDGGVLECPAHFAKFCLRTGAVLSPPATVPLTTFRVRVEGDDVLVAVAPGTTS